MYQQIKDKHSVIIWCAARCFSSFQRSIAPMENTPNKGRFVLHRINECQLFLRSTIRKFKFGPG
ncbi:hypothetical protein NQZ68_007723 [Dissostichus eleginoides]|nr:hypothetical protein NQZ68_007723 [Dissostichus eleginoides]